MNDNVFAFCPACGSKNIQTLRDGFKWQCPDCGFELFNNVASAVGLVISNARHEVLFEVRAKDPRKGFLALPGGFCDCDESAEQAAVRECREELGLVPQNLRYLCSWPNTYPYKNMLYKTCDLFFSAALPQDASFTVQQNEVSELKWISVRTKEDVKNLPLAFESARKTLFVWLEEQ
ncbi:MAG: NUDIX domain-containing protein [Treponema sp.]|nr:NUDIX domain-containing protein [Treponema sp.]